MTSDGAVGAHQQDRGLGGARRASPRAHDVFDGRSRRKLQAGVDGGLDNEIAVGLAREHRRHFGDPVGDEAEARLRRRRAQLRGMGERLGILVDVDLVRFGEEAQNLPGPRPGAVDIACRREIGRRLDEAGEQRGFGQRDVFRLLVEIGIDRRADPVIAAAEIDAVQIKLQNLLFREAAFEPERDHELFSFTPESPIRLEKQVLRKLLRDRGAALHDLIVVQVRLDGAREADRIEAEMIEKPPVLRGEHRLDEVRRNVLVRDVAAPHAALGDEFPVARENRQVRRQPQRHCLPWIGQDGGVIGDDAYDDERDPAKGDKHPGDETQEGPVRAAPGLRKRRLRHDPDRDAPDEAPERAQRTSDHAHEKASRA